ncbi:N-alpha-acetyltransferase 80 isoform X3 [Haemaphysalis longicornis]
MQRAAVVNEYGTRRTAQSSRIHQRLLQRPKQRMETQSHSKPNNRSGNVSKLVELHNRPEYINACCNVLNNEWKRSHTARFHSLSKSSSNLPVSLVLLKPLQGRESQLIGHSKLCRVLHDDKACFVESVIVIPEERGKGYGKLIMKLTEEYARTKGFARCYLSTHDKERFYEAIGYAVCSPVCGISGTMDHMDRFLRLFDRNANGPPESRKALTDVCERKVASEESTDLPPPPPPPPVPPPSAKTKSVVPNKQVWMVKQL